jgi:hypothetical protein
LPRVPSWSTLAATNSPESVAGRAGLYTLARETTAHISAHQLTETLRTRVPRALRRLCVACCALLPVSQRSTEADGRWVQTSDRARRRAAQAGRSPPHSGDPRSLRRASAMSNPMARSPRRAGQSSGSWSSTRTACRSDFGLDELEPSPSFVPTRLTIVT